MKKPLMSLSALFLAAGVAGAAAAQQGTPQQSPQQGQPGAAQAGQPSAQQAPQGQPNPALGDASDISDAEVEKFAEAQSKVEEIKGQYQSQVKAASEDPQQAMDVQREAQQEMVKAVKDTGLDVRKYNQIAQLAQYDTDLRQRIQENM